MKTKKPKLVVHRWEPPVGTLCGKGILRTNKDSKVTCGRCKLLAKFAAKRAKKGTR